MTTITMLQADAQWFSSQAKDLIVAGKSFDFLVTGDQAQALRPFIFGWTLRDVPKMGLDRRLRPIQAVALIAEGGGRPVRFKIHGDEIVGSVAGPRP